jgi:hypothetical protein
MRFSAPVESLQQTAAFIILVTYFPSRVHVHVCAYQTMGEEECNLLQSVGPSWSWGS